MKYNYSSEGLGTVVNAYTKRVHAWRYQTNVFELGLVNCIVLKQSLHSTDLRSSGAHWIYKCSAVVTTVTFHVA